MYILVLDATKNVPSYLYHYLIYIFLMLLYNMYHFAMFFLQFLLQKCLYILLRRKIRNSLPDYMLQKSLSSRSFLIKKCTCFQVHISLNITLRHSKFSQLQSCVLSDTLFHLRKHSYMADRSPDLILTAPKEPAYSNVFPGCEIFALRPSDCRLCI